MQQVLLQMIAQVVDGLNGDTSKPEQIEVPLSLMIQLAQELSTEKKSVPKSENMYYQLLSYLLNKDMLNTWKCI